MSNEFKPYIPADQDLPAMTIPAVILGAMLAVVFGAANAYLGLRMGTTVAASIPAAVISMCLLRVVLKRTSILENNIVQTIASAGEAVAAGSIFTMPAIFYWAHEGKVVIPSLLTITIVSMCGGFLGIFFMIPLRDALIVKEHETLPYPEGTACAQVLLAGESGGSNAKPLFLGIALASLFKFITGMLKVIGEEIIFEVKALRTAFAVDVSAAFVSVGYVCGIKVASYMFAGAIIGWYVLIPAITLFGADTIIFPAKVTVSALYAEGGAPAIWSNYIRYIGAGGVAVAGLFSLSKNIPMLISTFKQSIGQIKTKSGETQLDRTSQNLPPQVIIIGVIAAILVLWLCPIVPMGLLSVLLAVAFAFFFSCVSSRIVGLIGASNNPGSSMTIASLIISIPILKIAGYSGPSAMVTAICLGTVVCSASAISADGSQDLKTGFLIGATPKKQQIASLIGVFVMAFFIGGILVLMDKAWGFGSASLPAPQATMMKMIVEGIMRGDLPWSLICIGAAVTCAAELLGVPSLPVAMGMYLPFQLSATILCGGLIRKFTDNRRKKLNTATQDDSKDTGVLFCSGLIAGEGLLGVIMALFAVTGVSKIFDMSGKIFFGKPGELFVFALIILSVLYMANKPSEK